MDKLLASLDGKKTYIVAVATGAIALAQMFGVEIPDWVWTLLSAAGLGAVRSALPPKDAASN